MRASFLLAFALGLATFGTSAAQEKKGNPLEGKKGTAIGKLVAKGERYIEVKADGEEAPRKYVPQWKGGLPAQGGGPDKAMLKTFSELKVGSRVEVQWHFNEHLRVIGVKLLKAPAESK